MSNCSLCPSKGACGKQADGCDTQNNRRNKIRHVIGAMSGKGNVRKSSMSVLMVGEVARRGFRVGIMGTDTTGPSIPRLMGLRHAQALGTSDVIKPVVDKDGIKVVSLDFLMRDESQPVVWRGPIVMNAVKQSQTDVVWKELDYLFIDMPPRTGDVALTALQSLPISGVVMISTPQPMVSMIVSKIINICKQAKIEVPGIIEGINYVVCPDCGKRIEISQHHNVEDFIRESELSLWAELPMMDSVFRICRDNGSDMETAQQMCVWISPTVDQLIERMGK